MERGDSELMKANRRLGWAAKGWEGRIRHEVKSEL